MILWRLSPAAYAHAALTGTGAALRGGRWNSKGMAAVYASLDPATTVLEALTTFDPSDAPEGGFRLLQLGLPDDAPMLTPDLQELPARWNCAEKSADTQAFGDHFLRSGQALLMIVPSATLAEARNAVINPAHPRAAEIKVVHSREFSSDPRWPPRYSINP